jgi:hypothetical protein
MTVLPGPFGMVLMQIALYWWGLALFCRRFARLGSRRVALLLLIGFFPPVFGLLGVVWKDVFMMGCLTLAAGLLTSAPRPLSVGRCLAAGVLVFAAAAARHNALAAAVPFCLWIAAGRSAPRDAFHRLLVSSAAIACLIALVTVGFSRLVVNVSNPPLWRYFMFYDLVGIAAAGGEGLPKERHLFLTESLTAQEIQRDYTPTSMLRLIYGSDVTMAREGGLLSRLRPGTEGALRVAWAKAITRRPGAYIRHRLSHFAALLNVGGRAWNPVYFEVAPNPYGYGYQPSIATHAAGAILWRLSRTPLYWTWLYLGLLLGTLPAGWRLWTRARDPEILVLASSGVLYAVSYLPISIAPDFRYGLWTIAAAVLCLARLAGGPSGIEQRGVGGEGLVADRPPGEARVDGGAGASPYGSSSLIVA